MNHRNNNEEAFTVEFFNERVLKELLEFPKSVRARSFFLLDKMKTEGPNLGDPFTKKIVGTTGLFEVRAKAKEGIGRVFYCTKIGKRIVVLHAFVKKTQKTPSKNLQIALSRYKEFHNENN